MAIMWKMAMMGAAVAALLSGGGPALAQPVDLATSAHVTERLVAARVGDHLRKTCPQASVRWMRVWGEVDALKSWARERGHTEASVKAFLKDRSQKDRIYGLARVYLDRAGFTGGADSACAVAQSEVSKGTAVGQLLRVR